MGRNETDMVDGILNKVKGTTKAAIADARKAQGELEAVITSAFKKFEEATGMQIRYVSVMRKKAASEKGRDGCIASYHEGAISTVTLDVQIKKD